MACQHSTPLRGLLAAAKSSDSGRFGRLFPGLPAANFGTTEQETIEHLTLLAKEMTAPPDTVKDGPDAEESGIPALYTYFGQFIDHDITFDPLSSLAKQQDAMAVKNFRTPALDLDNVYGRGPHDQPYMYQDDGRRFRLGNVLRGEGVPDAHDLPRFGGRALIGDPRNDENTIVSQLQGLVLRFHNRFARENPNLSFEQVQERVRHHYQYVVLNDFLPRIVNAYVLNELKTGGRYDKAKLKFFCWDRTPFIPIEFSVAAYRLGHSMIRIGYRLNNNDNTRVPIFPIVPESSNGATNSNGAAANGNAQTSNGITPPPTSIGLTGFQPIADGRAIDWARFIPIEKRPYGHEPENGKPEDPDNKFRLQLAYRLDTSLVFPLGHLPPPVVATSDPPASLAARNLLRGWALKLPSGQAVAKVMGVKPLTDEQIVIGKTVDDLNSEPQKPIADIAYGVFKGNCPLWTYILAETRHFKTKMPVVASGVPDGGVWTPQLGPVGGRIVAEVLVGLVAADTTSYLYCSDGAGPKEGFALVDLVAYALGK